MTDLERVRAAWKADCEAYEDLFSELIRTQPPEGSDPALEHREAVRFFWKASAHLLNQYVRVYGQHGEYLEPMPLVPLARFALHFEELGNGIVPDLIENARAPGRPLRWGERRDISKAVYFLEAVDSGEIAHPAPVKTVAECFNVTKQTVRNWRSRSEDICKGQYRPHPDMLEKSMRGAGARYAVLGRGAPSS